MICCLHLVPLYDFGTGVDRRLRWFAEERECFAWFEGSSWFLSSALGLLGGLCADPFFFFFEKFFDSAVGEAAWRTNYHSFFWVDLDAQSATR